MEKDALFEAVSRAAADDGSVGEDEKARIWERFGETRAVLAVDSSGFTRAIQKHGIVFVLSVIAEFRALAAEILKRGGALRWRARMDNLFVEFDSPGAALDAAFDLHRRLEEEPISLGEGASFRVCIGIGYGRLLRSDHEGMFGEEMNLASKLGEDLAGPGETFLTEAAMAATGETREIVAERKTDRISKVDITYYSVNPK